MEAIMLHYSVVGTTRKLAERFKYPSKHYKNFREESEKIIIVGGYFYKEEDAFLLSSFIETHKDKIVGAIVCNDKGYGSSFGDTAIFYEERDIPVLCIWDLIVTDEEIARMEEIIDEKI